MHKSQPQNPPQAKKQVRYEEDIKDNNRAGRKNSKNPVNPSKNSNAAAAASSKSSSSNTTTSKGVTLLSKPVPLNTTSNYPVLKRGSAAEGPYIPLLKASEAAAKLSLPWPPREQLDQSKSELTPTDSNDKDSKGKGHGPTAKLSPSFIREMRNFLQNNQVMAQTKWDRILRKNSTTTPQSTKESARKVSSVNPQLRLKGKIDDETVEAFIEAVKLEMMQGHLSQFKSTHDPRYYQPSIAPKFNHVETNWPGFEQKPVDNWIKYAIPPPRPDPSSTNDSTSRDADDAARGQGEEKSGRGGGGSRTTKGRSKLGLGGGRSKSVNKKRRSRILTYSGGCQF